MAITPMFFEQIEKFQCLKLSTAQGPAYGTLWRHVPRVQKRVSKFSIFRVKNLQKLDLSDLTDNEVFLYALLAFSKNICHLSWGIF